MAESVVVQQTAEVSSLLASSPAEINPSENHELIVAGVDVAPKNFALHVRIGLWDRYVDIDQWAQTPEGIPVPPSETLYHCHVDLITGVTQLVISEKWATMCNKVIQWRREHWKQTNNESWLEGVMEETGPGETDPVLPTTRIFNALENGDGNEMQLLGEGLEKLLTSSGLAGLYYRQWLFTYENQKDQRVYGPNSQLIVGMITCLRGLDRAHGYHSKMRPMLALAYKHGFREYKLHHKLTDTQEYLNRKSISEAILRGLIVMWNDVKLAYIITLRDNADPKRTDARRHEWKVDDDADAVLLVLTAMIILFRTKRYSDAERGTFREKLQRMKEEYELCITMCVSLGKLIATPEELEETKRRFRFRKELLDRNNKKTPAERRQQPSGRPAGKSAFSTKFTKGSYSSSTKNSNRYQNMEDDNGFTTTTSTSHDEGDADTSSNTRTRISDTSFFDAMVAGDDVDFL